MGLRTGPLVLIRGITFKKAGILPALVLTLAACAGPDARSKKTVSQLMAAGDHGAAARLIESRKGEYGDSNAVLYNLDLALALHSAGSYRESSRRFEAAESRLEELYTESVSAAGGRFLANENIQDFRGQPLDRVLCQLFDALNYAILGKGDEALVAVRRMEAFLAELGRISGGGRLYADDGLAHYVAALLYSESGRIDDARISFEAAQKAYARYKTIHGVEPPTLAAPAVPEDVGELVLLHFNGPAPRKVAVSAMSSEEPSGEQAKLPGLPPAAPREGIVGGVTDSLLQAGRGAKHAVTATAQAAVGASKIVAGAILKTSYPRYVQDAFRIVDSEIETSEGKVRTEVFTDVFAISSRELKADAARLKARSSLRAALKLASQAATGISAADSEFADVRSWSTLPSQIRMARCPLKPGSYRVLLRRFDAAGNVISTRVFENVLIRAGHRTWLTDQTAA